MWSITPGLAFTKAVGESPMTTITDSGFVSVVNDGPHPSFLVHDGTRSTIVSWDGVEADISTIDRPLLVLCGRDGSLVGLEDDPTTGAAAAPRTVVQGPSLAALRPVELGEPEQRLLAAPETAASCLPDGGLAVVGPAEAREYHDGTWHAVASDVGTALQGRRQLLKGLPARAAGEVWQAGTIANLHRDAKGWHLAPGTQRSSAYVVIDGALLRYP